MGPFSFRARPFQSPADYTRIPPVLEPSWHEVNIYTFETESTEKKGKHASGPVTGEVGYSPKGRGACPLNCGGLIGTLG